MGRYPRIQLESPILDYAHNPLIQDRGAVSIHAQTDQAVLRRLSNRFGSVFTTEPAVHNATGIP